MFSSSRSSAPLGAVVFPVDWRLAAVWLLVAALAQATLVHFFAIRGAVPSLVLLAVATYATRAPLAPAILFGAAGGFLDDALAGNTGAAWTIATTLVAGGISLSSRVLFTDSLTIFSALVLVATLVREAAYFAALSFEGNPAGLGTHYVKLAVASAVYTALLTLVAGWARWRFRPPR